MSFLLVAASCQHSITKANFPRKTKTFSSWLLTISTGSYAPDVPINHGYIVNTSTHSNCQRKMWNHPPLKKLPVSSGFIKITEGSCDGMIKDFKSCCQRVWLKRCFPLHMKNVRQSSLTADHHHWGESSEQEKMKKWHQRCQLPAGVRSADLHPEMECRGWAERLRSLGGATLSVQTSGESHGSRSTRMTII